MKTTKVQPYGIIGFNPYKLVSRILRTWKNMSPEEQDETFMILHNSALALKGLLLELKDRDPELDSRLDWFDSVSKHS